MPQPGCVTKIVRCSTDQSALPPWGLAFETQPKALSLNETAAFVPDTSLTVAPAAPPLVSAPLIDGSGFFKRRFNGDSVALVACPAEPRGGSQPKR